MKSRIFAGRCESLLERRGALMEGAEPCWKTWSLDEGKTFKRITKRVRIDNETVVPDVLTFSKEVVGYKSGQDFRG